MRLLIISCSARKKVDDDLIPASERYDGTFYRVIRKAIREGGENLDIAIISAKFGLIGWDTGIPAYDQVITPERVQKIERDVKCGISSWFSRRDYSKIFVNLGKRYAPLVENVPQLLSPKTTWATGRIGERASQMKAWLQSPES